MHTQTSNKEKKRKKLQTHNHWSKPRSMVSINHTKCLPKHQTTEKKKNNEANREALRYRDMAARLAELGAVKLCMRRLGQWELLLGVLEWRCSALLKWRDEMKRGVWYDWRAVGESMKWSAPCDLFWLWDRVSSFIYKNTIELWVMETELSFGQTTFLLWVPLFLSYELWKLRIELRKLLIQTGSKVQRCSIWINILNWLIDLMREPLIIRGRKALSQKNEFLIIILH